MSWGAPFEEEGNMGHATSFFLFWGKKTHVPPPLPQNFFWWEGEHTQAEVLNHKKYVVCVLSPKMKRERKADVAFFCVKLPFWAKKGHVFARFKCIKNFLNVDNFLFVCFLFFGKNLVPPPSSQKRSLLVVWAVTACSGPILSCWKFPPPPLPPKGNNGRVRRWFFTLLP